jgi:hypothetical protein
MLACNSDNAVPAVKARLPSARRPGLRAVADRHGRRFVDAGPHVILADRDGLQCDAAPRRDCGIALSGALGASLGTHGAAAWR